MLKQVSSNSYSPTKYRINSIMGVILIAVGVLFTLTMMFRIDMSLSISIVLISLGIVMIFKRDLFIIDYTYSNFENDYSNEVNTSKEVNNAKNEIDKSNNNYFLQELHLQNDMENIESNKIFYFQKPINSLSFVEHSVNESSMEEQRDETMFFANAQKR